jgi:hypothetical protein
MKLVNVKFLTSVITMLTLSLLCIERPALAQSNCKEAKGNFVESFDGVSTSTGTLTNGGWLDGTTVSVFNSPGLPTPDPTVVTFASTFTLTTHQGQLKGSNRLYLLDLVRGVGVSMVKIDPVASTGIFAGASGVLFLDLLKSTTVAVGPYYEVVGGQVCFAGER